MDIEQRDHEKTVAVLRELAGLRTRVPSHGDSTDRPPFRANELNELRALGGRGPAEDSWLYSMLRPLWRAGR